MTGQTVLAFLPAALYLALVTLLLFTLRRCPEKVHLLALLVGIPAQIMTLGWADALLSVGAGALLFVFGVLFTARMVSGASLFSLCVTMALLPPMWGWAGLVGGLLLAGLVSLVRMLRTFGRDRVNMLTFETLSGMGVLPGVMGRPDLDRLPTREDAEAALAEHEATGAPVHAGARMYLAPYLLSGVLVVAAIHIFAGVTL